MTNAELMTLLAALPPEAPVRFTDGDAEYIVVPESVHLHDGVVLLDLSAGGGDVQDEEETPAGDAPAAPDEDALADHLALLREADARALLAA